MSAKFRVIYLAGSSERAESMRQVLAESHITAFALSEALDSAEFQPMDWIVHAQEDDLGYAKVATKLVVHRDDALVARKLALDTENRWREAALAAPQLVQLDDQTGMEHSWPLCPHCARPRLATCPICQTSGADFHPAFLPEASGSGHGDEEPPLLAICPTCDEPFVPVHPARCEWCGHGFADGYEPVASAPPPVTTSQLADFNARIAVLLVAIAISFASAIAWFYYVLR